MSYLPLDCIFTCLVYAFWIGNVNYGAVLFLMLTLKHTRDREKNKQTNWKKCNCRGKLGSGNVYTLVFITEISYKYSWNLNPNNHACSWNIWTVESQKNSKHQLCIRTKRHSHSYTFRHCPRTEQNISCFGAQKYVKHDPVHLLLKNCLSIKRNPKIYTNGKP